MNTGVCSSRESHCFSLLQLREYQKKNSLSVPAGAKKKRKIKNGNDTETAASDGCHSPEEVSVGWPGLWDRGAQGRRGAGKKCQVLVLVENSGFESYLSARDMVWGKLFKLFTSLFPYQ